MNMLFMIYIETGKPFNTNIFKGIINKSQIKINKKFNDEVICWNTKKNTRKFYKINEKYVDWLNEKFG